ncbi:MAG: hypothetical protein Ct9H90mP27_7740 [Gammaproteobacteria bacterium]|nr:MAG: hypothetical protein Ct9H90mP27_7740 [Gammaproteobacteria bacterium]
MTVLILEAFAFEIYLQVALFIQIIVTNCAILERAESLPARIPSFRVFSMQLGHQLALLSLLSLWDLKEKFLGMARYLRICGF